MGSKFMGADGAELPVYVLRLSGGYTKMMRGNGERISEPSKTKKHVFPTKRYSGFWKHAQNASCRQHPFRVQNLNSVKAKLHYEHLLAEKAKIPLTSSETRNFV